MIYNDRQKNISSTKLDDLRKAYELTLHDEDSPLKNVHLASIQGLMNDIAADIKQYDLLKSGKVSFTEHTSLESLPIALISARIASGMSQSDLAEMTGMKPQQIQRYEATSYMSASLSRLIEFASALGIRISETWSSESESSLSKFYSWSSEADIDWNKFPVKEMLKRNWLKLNQKDNPVHAVKSFFFNNAGPEFISALHRKKFYGENLPNEYALLAWQARILEKAKEESEAGEIREFALDDSWVPKLKELTQFEDGPLRAKHFLAQKGIILITETHLKSTYLDGAAMLGKSGNPVIGLTLRHDRLDNFWFVLFHELGHVFLHLFDNLGLDFFDENDGEYIDSMEEEANRFALDHLIPEDDWDTCISRFITSDENIINDSQKVGVHSSILAGRIRKELNDYTILNNLVGQGAVKKLYKEFL